MPRRRPHRDCELLCEQCRRWKHFSHFGVDRRSRGGTTSTMYRRICKVCEQTNRDQVKRADRALAIIDSRAKTWSGRLGCPKEFLWTNMNWRALVPILRALMSDEGLCLSCGHPFRSDRDIQIEHHEPPRHPQDWARHHARNLVLMCGSCNTGKGALGYSVWLDQEELKRLSVTDLNRNTNTASQLDLFA